MIRPLVCYALMVISLGLNAHAADDVAYKLQTDAFAPAEEPHQSQLLPLAIADRAWSVPGVEQSTTDLQPPRSFGLRAPREFRTVYVAGSRRPVVRTEFVDDRSCWLDDAVWPLTRDLWSRTDFGPDNTAPPTCIPPIPLRGFDGMNLAADR